MTNRALVLADRARLEQFTLLGRARRLFEAGRRVTWTDAGGVPWAGVRAGNFGFAVAALGPGWVFDPYVAGQRAPQLAERKQRLLGGGQAAVDTALDEALGSLRLGGRCERALWSVHRRLLDAGRSVFRVPDAGLARDVYGADAAG